MYVVKGTDLWSVEGSGGSGEDDPDLIWLTDRTTTATSGHPGGSDVTNLVFSVIKHVTNTATSPVTAATSGASGLKGDATVLPTVTTYVTSTVMPLITTTEGGSASIPVERLCIFFGVLFVLIVLAVGICIYVKYFHGRNTVTITKA